MLPIRIKACSESDLRMLGTLARNIQRVLPVTQADIDAAAALGKGWVVWKVIEVNDPIDNLRGGTQLVIKQNSITPGQNVRRVLIVSGPGGETVVIGPGPSPLLLPDAIANTLSYVKAFGGTEQGVPDGYTQLEYIVFDTTQVIDTGFTPDNNSRIESKCYRTGEDCWFYGAGPSNPRITLYHSTTGTCRWGYQSRSNVGFVANTEYTIIEDKNGLNINGVDNPWTSGTADDFTCDRSLTIGNNNGSTGTRYFAGNFYYMKIYDNGVLARDFVPCKNASNVVGLYDRVNGVFYTDTGLVAGPTVVPAPDAPINIVGNNGKLVFRDTELPVDYKRLKDIVFDGETYYVTDVYLTGADTTSFVMNAAESGRNALGCYTGNSSGNNISFYISTGNSGNYVRYKDGLYRPVIATAKLNTDLSLSIGPTGTTGFDTDATWAELEFTCPNELYIGWLANATSPKFVGSFNGNITISDRATLVPCERVSDGAIGYYNINDNVFFENQGTGTPTTSGYDYSHYDIMADGTVETIEDTIGNTATAEMLLKVGDYQDVQSIIDGAITRKCGAVVLDSSFEWTYDSTYGRVNATIPNLWGSTVARTIPGFCTHFKWLSHQESISSITAGQCYSAGANRIFLHISQTSAAAFSAWLDAQRDAGTPVIIVFPLENATTESVTGQTLQVQAGDNTLEITQASLSGLELEAEYTKAE